jgi:hypothetical protein
MIEPKGMNAFPVKSVLRLFISSNERWVVPATEDERRFFVLNVNNKRKGDYAYFTALRDEMNGDGPAALLNFLLSYDLSRFEVRDVPDTEGLAEQKLQGFKNVEAWWFNVLQTGCIHAADKQNTIHFDVWARDRVRMTTDDFRDAYVGWMRTRRFDGQEVGEIEFGRRIARMTGNLEKKRLRIGNAREYVYVLPPLDVCRELFEQFIGSKVQWPDDTIAAEIDDDL